MAAVRATVAVIGAGIVGSWLADLLAGRGHATVLIDPAVAHTPSLDSGGLIRTGADPHWANGFRRYRELADPRVVHLTGAEIAGTDSGGSAHTPATSGRWPAPASGGLPSGHWRHLDDAGWVDASGVLRLLRTRARERGAVVLDDRVERISRARHGWRIELSRGRIGYAAAVIVCAGADTLRVSMPHLPLPRPRFRSISYSLVQLRRGEQMPAGCVINRGGGGWLRPTAAAGVVLCGAYDTRYLDSRPALGACTSGEAERIAATLKSWWPPIARGTVVGGRMSYDLALPTEARVAMTADHTLVTACGFDGGGFKIAPALAEHILAELPLPTRSGRS